MNATYFEDPTDRLQHAGKEIGVIKRGDTQTAVNEKLAAELEALKNQMSRKEPQNVGSTSTIINDSSFGIDKNLVDSGERLNVKVEPKDDKIFVSYNFTMPNGAEKVSSDVSIEGIISGNQTLLSESPKLISGFYLNPDNFPATLNFNVDMRTGNSLDKLTARVQLNPTGDNTDYTVYKRNINNSDLKNQKEVNEFLFREVNRLNKSTEENKIFYKGGQMTLTEIVLDLTKEVSELRKQASKIPTEAV